MPFGKLEQGDYEFNATLCYNMSSETTKNNGKLKNKYKIKK